MFSFLRKNKGQTFTEYALILVFVGLIVAIGSIQLFDASEENYKQGLIPTRTAEMEGLPPVPEGFYDSGNQRPVAVIQGPLTVHRGDWVTYTNASYDPDGTIKMVSWGGYAASQSGNSIRLQFPNDGTYQIKLTVVDDKGLASSTVIEVQVGNRKPVANIVVSPSSNIYWKHDITISSTGTSDPDGDKITEWVWKIDGVVQNWPLTGGTVKLSPGNHVISLIVKDHWDAWSTEVTKVIYVNPNTKPIAQITISPSTTVMHNQTLQISGSNSVDPTGDAITQCKWMLNGVQQSWGCNGVSRTFSPGTYTVTLQVADEYGMWSDVVSRQFVVQNNRKPEVLTLTVTPSTNIRESTNLTFNFTWRDLDGDSIVAQEWKVDNGTATSSPPKNLIGGNHTVSLRIKDSGGLWSDWKSITVSVIVEHYEKTFNYTGSQQTFTVPYTGTYKIEVWGAQGGSAGTIKGGKGGYATGTISLKANDVLYIYVGGKGGDGYINGPATSGGFNGGGKGGFGSDGALAGGGGGGASDVRFGGNQLANRIIVAGGGGGAVGTVTSATSGFVGGAGGGVYGESGKGDNYNAVGKGGSQESGGNGGYGGTNNGGRGGLGYGGDGSGNYYEGGGGGGGGYYGGGAGGAGTGSDGSGGGGSGYINISKFSNTSMSTGVREGHGLIKITLISQ